MTDVVLYDFPMSSASYRLRIALGLAGIKFTSAPVDLTKGEHRAPEHQARNPQGFVPVLEIDGLRLTQSMAILQYLDTTRDLGLFPAAPAERARVEAAAHVIALDIHPVCNLSVARFATELTNDPETRATWSRHFMRRGMVAFEEHLKGFEQAPFACGEKPGIVDICLIPQLYNCRRWKVEMDDLGRTLAVEAACADHPAFAAAHPDAIG